jgi:hypothetical protein
MKKKLLIILICVVSIWFLCFRKTVADLDTSTGFEQYIYGTSIKQYKDFTFIPTAEVFQQYLSKVSFKYKDVQIDSIGLFFYKEKLYGIELYIDESEREKMKAELEKSYGYMSAFLSEENEYSWKGKKVNLSIYAIGNKQYAVHFEKLEDKVQRMNETLDSLLKGDPDWN